MIAGDPGIAVVRYDPAAVGTAVREVDGILTAIVNKSPAEVV